MDTDHDDASPQSQIVAGCWQQYRTTTLPSAIGEVTTELGAAAQLSYFHGARAMLTVLRTVMEESESQGATEIALDMLAEELEDLIGDDEADLN